MTTNARKTTKGNLVRSTDVMKQTLERF